MPVSALFVPRRASPRATPVVRLGRRTKALAPTLAPGAVVVLEHADLDALAAEALARRKPAAVVNLSPFITGRYPNRGPGILLDAGVPMYECDLDLFALLKDGERVDLKQGRLLRPDGSEVAELKRIDADAVRERLCAARANLDGELTHFAQNTLRFLDRTEERRLLLDAVPVPPIETVIAGRHVLVVVRGDGYEHDLQRLRPYLREMRPVLIAVDGAADALLGMGLTPDIILGDMDSVSDGALRAAKEIVVHAYPSPRPDGCQAPGHARVSELGITPHLFPVAGTSEDAALLLAHEKGADLIVAVGTHSNLEDFLDKGRGGMASTFLVRLKVGSRLVDARGVSRLYGDRRSSIPLMLLLALSALFPVAVLIAGTPFGQMVSRAAAVWWRTVFR